MYYHQIHLAHMRCTCVTVLVLYLRYCTYIVVVL